MTNTIAGGPSPNHNSASGSSAIAGSGLNIAVSVDSRSVPMRVETASVVTNAAASTSPMRVADQQHAQRDARGARAMTPDDDARPTSACIVSREGRKQERIVRLQRA